MDDFDALYATAKPVPHATDTGRQVGVVPPSQRRPKPGACKVVDNAQAVANMAARKAGEMDAIEGGIDDNRGLTAPEPTLKEAASLVRPEKNEKDNFDLTDDDGTVEREASSSALLELAKAIRELRADRADNKADSSCNHGDQGPNMSNPYMDKEIGHYGHYHETHTVTMEIRQEHQDGTFASIMTVGLPVSHILQNSNSITLITPITNNQYTFQPTAGSDILLNGGGLNNVHVFYPGTSFVLDEYKLSGMCFVKAK